MSEPDAAEILVKYEGVCVGGSVKTRTAAMMIEQAEKRGDIGPGSIIVEPTSGNQGIGLALVCAVKGYEARIIMPDSVSEERRKLVAHYGANVIVVHDEGDIGKAIDECIQIANRMAAEDPRVYVPQQFENIDNLRTHRNHTALEIAEDAGCHIHGFCSGIGTGGTISGVGQTLKRLYPDIEIWAVEPENAAILSGGGNVGAAGNAAHNAFLCGKVFRNLDGFLVFYDADIVDDALVQDAGDDAVADAHLYVGANRPARQNGGVFRLNRPNDQILVLRL
jgi:cysteine synthase A